MSNADALANRTTPPSPLRCLTYTLRTHSSRARYTMQQNTEATQKQQRREAQQRAPIHEEKQKDKQNRRNTPLPGSNIPRMHMRKEKNKPPSVKTKPRCSCSPTVRYHGAETKMREGEGERERSFRLHPSFVPVEE
ncbi:hypothetical protein EJ06DRAFT_56265 [Trichodelitschia bisporula]|uniref:Uncharacterized protein n=1 Tax=Trichodelitschia bisporula TaxID=703511 RepID=A0A6G1HU66_9PEZI|nr:hypothetical protein EJ06DRAFT_56265 [Trichodelitschia bisporula]